MNDDDKKFRLVTKWGDAAERELPVTFDEPVEAVEYAENFIGKFSPPAWAKIYFNGETEPQHLLVLQGKTPGGTPIFGLFNTETVRWPVYYPPSGDSGMLSLDDLPAELQEIAMKSPDADKSEKGEDATKMKLDSKEEEDEKGIDDDDEEDTDEGGTDEGTDDEESAGEDEEEFDNDDEAEDSWEADEADEDATEEEQGGEEDGDFSGGESDEEGEDDSEDESDDDGEDEVEMPRLNIFAKIFTPSGARKRAEIKTENERNRFRVVFGIVNDEAEKVKEQEREQFASVTFIESDDDRANGTLMLTVPEEAWETMEIKGRTITLKVPYRSEDGE